MGIELTNDQVYAIYDLENWWHGTGNQVFEISGRPGSGKSFLIKYFIERIGLKLENVLMDYEDNEHFTTKKLTLDYLR